MNRVSRWIGLGIGLILVGCQPFATHPMVTQETPKPTPAVSTAAATATSGPTATPFNSRALVYPENASAGDPYAPELGNRGYEVQRYAMELVLDPAAEGMLQNQTVITAVSRMESLPQISLDFIGFEIDAVSADGKAADYFRLEDKLVINLPQAVVSGTTFGVAIAYHGKPEERPSRYVPFVPHLGLFTDGDRAFIVSEPDGSRFWFPCNDHPRDKAVFQVGVTVPEGLMGISNGELITSEIGIAGAFPGGRAGDRYVWGSRDPMVPAFVTVVVGDYVRLEGRSPRGIPLRHYVTPDQVETFRKSADRIGEMLDWMGERLGPYPFETFGYVTAPTDGYSLETQTLVLLSDDALEDDATLVHEMVHMWFGDWVSLDTWGQMWRSEGFATYLPSYWGLHDDPEQLDQVMEQVTKAILDDPSGYPLDAPPPEALFGNDSYVKGAVVAHALRKTMGDEAFFQGLRNYFVRYGGRTASDAEFWAVMEAAAGKSLAPFVEEWFGE